ncbi:hypothetical protein [Streptomyces glaucescens]|uniref:hypothetical protein n=1 Tax=Streptomyces glaucescens TaxID=1907 RepID=UPI00117D4756|nr:hypothetical protein [Streptomyces glaucescens]
MRPKTVSLTLASASLLIGAAVPSQAADTVRGSAPDSSTTQHRLSLPPGAQVDDSFTVETLDGCGAADFVDHGEGAPGGGSNDDYIVLHDYCSDGHGTRVWLYYPSTGNQYGSVYNGNGLAGEPVIWDPFGNVVAGQVVALEVCLVDGRNDYSGALCGEGQRTSADG